MHPDGAREIRTGVLMMLPVLPMPMICSKRLDDEHGTASSHCTVQPSHDLIAHLLNIAASHGQQIQHKQRQTRQKIAEDALFRAIDALDLPPSRVDQVWGAFCAYKRAYVESFTGQPDPDIRFADANTVTCDQRVFHLALDHAKSHDVFFGEDGRLGMCKTNSNPSYGDLVLRAARRLWWAGK